MSYAAEASGRPLFYLTAFDATAEDVAENANATLTVCEMQLLGACDTDPQAGTLAPSSAELCWTLYVPGRLTSRAVRRTLRAPRYRSRASCCMCRQRASRQRRAQCSAGTRTCVVGQLPTDLRSMNCTWMLCACWTRLGAHRTSTLATTTPKELSLACSDCLTGALGSVLVCRGFGLECFSKSRVSVSTGGAATRPPAGH